MTTTLPLLLQTRSATQVPSCSQPLLRESFPELSMAGHPIWPERWPQTSRQMHGRKPLVEDPKRRCLAATAVSREGLRYRSRHAALGERGLGLRGLARSMR